MQEIFGSVFFFFLSLGAKRRYTLVSFFPIMFVERREREREWDDKGRHIIAYWCSMFCVCVCVANCVSLDGWGLRYPPPPACVHTARFFLSALRGLQCTRINPSISALSEIDRPCVSIYSPPKDDISFYYCCRSRQRSYNTRMDHGGSIDRTSLTLS